MLGPFSGSTMFQHLPRITREPHPSPSSRSPALNYPSNNDQVNMLVERYAPAENSVYFHPKSVRVRIQSGGTLRPRTPGPSTGE